jgi:hypothetical protein
VIPLLVCKTMQSTIKLLAAAAVGLCQRLSCMWWLEMVVGTHSCANQHCRSCGCCGILQEPQRLRSGLVRGPHLSWAVLSPLPALPRRPSKLHVLLAWLQAPHDAWALRLRLTSAARETCEHGTAIAHSKVSSTYTLP